MNRRNFFGLGVLAAGGAVVRMVKGGPAEKPPKELPFVQLLSLSEAYIPAGSPLNLPTNVDVADYGRVLNAAYACQPNGSQLVPARGPNPTIEDLQAVMVWMKQHAPAGAGDPVPQVGFLGAVIVVVAVLAVGGVIVYGLWQLVKQIPPPDTNCPS